MPVPARPGRIGMLGWQDSAKLSRFRDPVKSWRGFIIVRGFSRQVLNRQRLHHCPYLVSRLSTDQTGPFRDSDEFRYSDVELAL